jgi:hypothetical protein
MIIVIQQSIGLFLFLISAFFLDFNITNKNVDLTPRGEIIAL